MKLIFVFFLFSFFPSICYCQQISIKGEILAKDLSPIKDVSIEIKEFIGTIPKTSTNGNGYFEFNATNLINTHDELTLICRHPKIPSLFIIEDCRINALGLIIFPKLLILEEKKEIVEVIPPPFTYIETVTGIVFGNNGLPLKGVDLQLGDYINKVKNATTDEHGIFQFDVTKARIDTKNKLTIYCLKSGSPTLIKENVRLDGEGLIIEPSPIIFGCDEGSLCDDGNKNTKCDKYDKNCNCISAIEIVNWKDYSKKHGILSFGLLGGIGFRAGYQVALDITPSSIRIGRPHPDDVKNIPQCIRDPNIPDNYLIEPNKTEFDIPNRISIDLVNVSIKGFVNFTIRTSPNKTESSEIVNRNLHRLNYILPGKGFDAFIYYSIKTKKNPINLSIPIYATLPIFNFGDNKRLTFRTVIGTNLIRPKIKLEAIKGWDRFGELTPDVHIDIGKIKESEWYGGFDVEGNSIQYGFQVALVNNVFVTSDSFESFKLEDKLNLSYWLKASYVFNKKK